MPLGLHLGCRDPGHLSRWQAALAAGKSRLPRCTGTTKLGRKCRHHVMVGSNRCHWHLHGVERDAFDQVRIVRLQRLSRLSDIGERGRQKARNALAHIERRRLHRAWKHDPTIPGVTLVLNPHQEKRVVELLLGEFGIDIEKVLPQTSRLPTPCCVDRLRWAAVLLIQGKTTLEKAKRRVWQAIAEDTHFFDKIDAFTAVDTPLLSAEDFRLLAGRRP